MIRFEWKRLFALSMLVIPSAVLAEGDLKLSERWTLSQGLSKPESVVYDGNRDLFYVSNINGDAAAKDGNGYISRISGDGTMLEAQWVAGLNAPKGLALRGDTLFAADIDTLVEIDVISGSVVSRYEAEGALFLNDVTDRPMGSLYVSDSRSNILYRLSNKRLAAWLADPRIQSPNGLYADRDYLIVAAGDDEAAKPGDQRYLRKISYDKNDITPVLNRTPLGRIDAVESDGRGGYFLTDWANGTVLRFTQDAGITEVAKPGRGAADLHFVAAKTLLVVPIMMSNQLTAYEVHWESP